MNEQTTTPPDWNAARRVAKDGIAMSKLIIDAVNAASAKPATIRRGKEIKISTKRRNQIKI